MKIQKNNLVIATIIVVLIAAYIGIDLKQNNLNDKVVQTSIVEEATVDDQQKIMQAYQQQLSNIQVQSKGEVKAILADDNDGSKHQKMILKLENGLTVLVAHNIDLAPRVEGLRKGEIVEFYGEYE